MSRASGVFAPENVSGSSKSSEGAETLIDKAGGLLESVDIVGGPKNNWRLLEVVTRGAPLNIIVPDFSSRFGSNAGMTGRGVVAAAANPAPNRLASSGLIFLVHMDVMLRGVVGAPYCGLINRRS
jgi:hypothetical protein